MQIRRLYKRTNGFKLFLFTGVLFSCYLPSTYVTLSALAHTKVLKKNLFSISGNYIEYQLPKLDIYTNSSFSIQKFL